MYVLSILASRLAIAGVIFAIVLLFRRRDSVSAAGVRTYEPNAAYFARIRSAAVAVLIACILLGVVFWAIVHFGPLRPVHEWFR
jgi:hypothetical protein